MKKISCLLVDDEPLAIALLERHIAQVDLLEVAGTCPNAMKALEVLRAREVDLLFLDIRMPSLSGLELLRMLRHPPRVILTTAHREYALDGFDLEIVDYLLKPIPFDRFLKAVDRVLRQLAPPAGFGAPAAAEAAVCYIKSGYKNIRVELDAILYMESLRDYVKVYTAAGVIVTKYKISEMEAFLGGGGFLRIHRSYIVNKKHVTMYTASYVAVCDVQLPIGESYKELVLKSIRDSG